MQNPSVTAVYSKPKLVEYGRVTQFTHGSAGGQGDGPGSKREQAQA